MMFPNLKAELQRKNISLVSVAKLINCTEKTLQNKMNGKTDFRLNEVLAINEQLLPEFELKYLFKRK